MSNKKLLEPNDFVITRKRKQYKFALFHNSDMCFELAEWTKAAVDTVEIGAGTGLFSVELATRHPDRQFVAVDVKADRLQKGAHEAKARGLQNIRFLRARADQLSECFDIDSIQSLWLTFPDPFPRTRSAGRRLTHPTFLKLYKSLLGADGSLYLKHDDRDFFCWSLEQIVNDSWTVTELSFDLHESDRAADYKIVTTYEQRWMSEGNVIHFVCAFASL